MTFDEVVRARRSIRRYQDRPVPDLLLREILDLSRYAPSSMDGQPWRFVVVRDAATKRALAAAKDRHCPPEKRHYPADFLATAPVVTAVCVDTRRAHNRERENGIIVTAFLLLAARAHGLGTVYLSAYQPDDPALALEIRNLLRLPADVEPITLVPLGYPDEIPAPKQLRPLAEMIELRDS